MSRHSQAMPSLSPTSVQTSSSKAHPCPTSSTQEHDQRALTSTGRSYQVESSMLAAAE
jgi:hypothetical protein